MPQSLAVWRKQLRLRSRYRGFKEADLLFGRFADRYLDGLDEQELQAYSALLDEPDQDVYAWVMGLRELPARHDNSIFKRLRDPDIAIS